MFSSFVNQQSIIVNCALNQVFFECKQCKMWLIMFYNTFYALDSAQSFWKPMKIVLCLAQTLHHNIQDMNRVNYFLAKLII